VFICHCDADFCFMFSSFNRSTQSTSLDLSVIYFFSWFPFVDVLSLATNRDVKRLQAVSVVFVAASPATFFLQVQFSIRYGLFCFVQDIVIILIRIYTPNVCSSHKVYLRTSARTKLYTNLNLLNSITLDHNRVAYCLCHILFSF